MKTLAVLCIGDELLDGRVPDQNASWLARQSRAWGAAVGDVRWLPDDVDAIAQALAQVAGRYETVVVSGGLGPTADDVTRDGAARFLDCALEREPALEAALRERFAQRGQPFTENNVRQCMFPSASEILATEVGTAAGFVAHRDGTSLWFFPGVPFEFNWFCERYLAPLLNPADGGPGQPSTRLFFFGLGESQLEDRLGNISAHAQSLGGRVGFLASYPTIEVSIKAPSLPVLNELRQRVLQGVGPWLIAEGEEPLAQRAGRLLVQRSEKLTVAESCTAGGLAHLITSPSGSSAWFDQGYVTYANSAKVELLGVLPELLEAHGAVSASTVCQMAWGARLRARATYALAISGIAGPTGGSADKPVGTVHLALATPEGIYHRLARWPRRTREQVRQASCHAALAMLVWHLEERLHEHRFDGPWQIEDVLALPLPEPGARAHETGATPRP